MMGFEFHRGRGARHGDVRTGNISLERVEHFKYLGTILINQNYIHEETKGRLKECLLSFGAGSFILHFAVQNLKIKI